MGSTRPGGSSTNEQRGNGGWWILFKPELHLGRDIIVPDLCGWRHERMPAFLNVPFFELAPDWVCEVASPRTARIDRAGKLPSYAREGVGHVWLVDALAHTLEVFRLEGGRWVVAADRGTGLIHLGVSSGPRSRRGSGTRGRVLLDELVEVAPESRAIDPRVEAKAATTSVAVSLPE